jgi:hypothetical protein
MADEKLAFPFKGTWSKLKGDSTVIVDILVMGFTSATIHPKDGPSRVCPVAVFQDLTDDSLRYAELKFITVGERKNATHARTAAIPG